MVFPFLHSQRQKSILTHVTETFNSISQKRKNKFKIYPIFWAFLFIRVFAWKGPQHRGLWRALVHAGTAAWPLPVSSARPQPAQKHTPPVPLALTSPTNVLPLLPHVTPTMVPKGAVLFLWLYIYSIQKLYIKWSNDYWKTLTVQMNYSDTPTTSSHGNRGLPILWLLQGPFNGACLFALSALCMALHGV